MVLDSKFGFKTLNLDSMYDRVSGVSRDSLSASDTKFCHSKTCIKR